MLFFIRIKSKTTDLLKFPRKTDPPSYLIEIFIVSSKKIMNKIIIIFILTTAALLLWKIQAFIEIKEFELSK